MAPTIPRQLALAEENFRSGNHDFAEKLLREVLLRAPSNSKANELLSYIAGNRGELDYSFELLKAATAAPDASGEAYYYLGKHYLDRGLFENATAAYRQSLRRIGDFFEGLLDLGVVLAGCGEAESALGFYDRALSLRPDFHQAWFNKGVALDDLKRFDDALQCYDKALSIHPGFAPAWDNRGATLNDLGCYEEAVASYDKAIALDPGNAQAWSNRGVALAALKRYQEALESQEKALTLNPDFAEAWGRGASVFAEQKYFDQAVTYFAKAFALKPNIPFLMGDWLHARMNICQWNAAGAESSPASGKTADARAEDRACDGGASDIERQFESMLVGIDATRRVSTPFVVLAIPSSPGQQRRCAEIYCKDTSPAPAATAGATKRPQQGRIRLGYFSPDFRSHALSFLTAGMFECHDRTRFETHAFALGVPGDDPMTTRLKAAFEHFHDVGNMPDRDIALLAQRLHIDIAVDLAGHMQGARTGVFARRAAPVQVHYLGYPGTMGAAYIDYLIADKTVIPEASRQYYSEKIVYLSNSYQVNDRKRTAVADLFSRESLGLPSTGFVFCCFNNNYKITPSTFDGWMRILKQVEGSVFLLYAENEWVSANLRKEAAARSVNPDRLVFGKQLPAHEYLARYRVADLFLDTLPYNAHTTASDALWAGLPVLTCMGESFAGRVAASLLNAIGLPELVTTTQHQYEALAIELATIPGRLKQIKQKLELNRLTTPLFDTGLFTRNIEAAYTQLVERYDADLSPDHIHVML